MTTLTVPRGEFHAALTSTLPHAGRETEDTPWLGRVRFCPTGSDLLAWCTDHVTSIAAAVKIVEHLDGTLVDFDLPVGEVRAALAVFHPPSGDARMSWDDELLQVEVLAEHVVLTEVGHLIDGRSLRVRRIVPAGQDRYPDVPRELVDVMDGPLTDRPRTRVKVDYLGRFQPAARAWGAPVHLTFVADPPAVLVRLGSRVIGQAPSRVIGQGEREKDRENAGIWRAALEPLRRPEPVNVPKSVVDDLTAQARDLLRAGGGVIDLTVVKAGDPS